MLASNHTPFAAIGFEQKHRDGADMAVIVARGQFRLWSDGHLDLADMCELVLADEYGGDPQVTPLIRVGDLIPFKPAADVTVLAQAHAARDKIASTWTVSVRVGQHVYSIRVSGPREWVFEGSTGELGWKLGEGKPVQHAPLDYRFAAGGLVLGDLEGNVDPRNPIGAGLLDRRSTTTDRSYPAPTIDSQAEPVGDPFARPEPQGFGPVPPWWLWRCRWAGTYDDAWLEMRHPQLPADFDYRFYQTAHPGLILPRYLRGDEWVEFSGLTPGGGLLGFALPGLQPLALCEWYDGGQLPVRLNLDGLHVDMRGDPPWLVELTWRAWIAISLGFYKIDLFYAALTDAIDMPACDEQGLVAAGTMT